ncbi:uncharacterized protein G2W53_024460 [Senna tora]|uniref:Uncharacterized protein n=1 Tax=Senna tora TaxID=362788 RepID=A0A834WD51_9FABA|nr:uncharacterized protein G2W53_024460 [Senna tora]
MEGGREDLLWKSEPAAESIVSLTLARSLEDGFALVIAQDGFELPSRLGVSAVEVQHGS